RAARVADPAAPGGVRAGAPAEAVVRGLARRRPQRSEERLDRRRPEEAAVQVRPAEADQVLGVRDEAPAGPLVAIVDVRRVQDPAGLAVALVERRAVRDDAVGVLRDDRAQPERIEDFPLHVRQERLPGRTLDHGADQVPAVARVGVAGAGLEEERVVLEDREAVENRLVAVAAEELVAAVMADAGEMARELARGDGPALLRE